MKNKGITLLALIVTVIIMVILASVSINLIMSGGIIDKTRTATKEYQYQADKEQFELAKIGATNYLTDEVDEEKMEIELEGWTHEEEKWTSSNGNEFTLEGKSSGGKEEEPEEIPDLLKRYILGQNLQGRNFMEIAIFGDDGLVGVKDDENTIVDASNTIEVKGLYSLEEEDCENARILIKYKSKYYKFQVNAEEMKTIADFGVVEFYKEDITSKVGKYVKYDNKNWIIIYDDKENGLQMISEDSLTYKGNEFGLGYNDTYLTEKRKLEGSTSLEKAIYSYNNAVDTLNSACQEIVPISENIESVRCVGSNPKCPEDKKTEYYSSEFLAENPIGNEGIGNNKGKMGDENYIDDIDRLVYLGIQYVESYEYLLASRVIEEDEDYVRFSIRSIFDGPFCRTGIWYIDKEEAKGSDGQNYYLRPVIKLKSEIQKNGFQLGKGTKENPYILN